MERESSEATALSRRMVRLLSANVRLVAEPLLFLSGADSPEARRETARWTFLPSPALARLPPTHGVSPGRLYGYPPGGRAYLRVAWVPHRSSTVNHIHPPARPAPDP